MFCWERSWKKALSPRKSYFERELGCMVELKLPLVAFMQLAGPIPPLPLNNRAAHWRRASVSLCTTRRRVPASSRNEWWS